MDLVVTTGGRGGTPASHEPTLVSNAPTVGNGARADGEPEPALEELVALLFLLTGNLRQRLTDRAAVLDLSFSQAMALRQLDQPVPMRELAQRLCCDASNVTGIVDRLEARGLVERRAVPDDRRVKHLEITAAGRALRQRLYDSFAEDLPLLELSSEERRLLVALLRRGVGADAVV